VATTNISLDEDCDKDIYCDSDTVGAEFVLTFDYYTDVSVEYDYPSKKATLTFNEENDCTESFSNTITITS